MGATFERDSDRALMLRRRLDTGSDRILTGSSAARASTHGARDASERGRRVRTTDGGTEELTDT